MKDGNKGKGKSPGSPKARRVQRNTTKHDRAGETIVLQNQLLNAISCAQAIFIGGVDSREAFDTLLSDILALTESEYGFIGEVLYTPEGQPYLKTHAITNISWNEATRTFYEQNAPKGMEFYNLRTLFGVVLTSGEPIISNDPARDPRKGGLPDGHPPLHSFLGIPIRVGDKLVAMAGIANRPGGYDQTTYNFLQPFLTTIGQLVEARRSNTERMRAEEEALRSEKTWSELIVSSAPNVIVGLGENSNILIFNKFAEKLTGYKAEEVIGKPWIEIFIPEKMRGQLYSIWDEIVKNKFIEHHYENPIMTKRGEERIISWNNAFITSNDEFRMVLSIGEDITQRKHAEERLRQSEEKYRVLVENAGEAIFIAQDGLLKFVNQKAVEISGYTQEELTSKPFVEFIHPDDRTGVMERYTERLKGEDLPVVIEFRIIHRSGKTLWVELFEAFIEWQGKPALLCFLTEVTERKSAEESLREATRIINKSPAVAFLWKNSEGWPVEFVSDNVKEVFGYSVEDFIAGKVAFSEIIHHEDIERVSQEVASFSKEEGQTDFVHEPYRIIDKSGRVKWLDDRTNIRRDEHGKITHYQGIVLDITERKRAEAEMASLQEQLRQSQKMEAIGRLAGGIAHDFNNLLTVIIGYSQLSLIELKENVPLRGNFQEIQKASEKAADLTRQLLAFSRRQILKMRVLDLNNVLRDMDKMLHRLIGEDIELITLLADELGRVKTDPGWIEQIIMNLAVNARDAMPSGGKLTIETANVELDHAYAREHISVEPGRYVMLSMSDTGVGMTEEVRDRIFEPFFTTKEKGQGTGLGLSTVYGIVKQSKGNIWVYSEPGKGTTFKIYLPRVDEPLEELKAGFVKEEIPCGSETILLVEDEEVVRKLAGRILKRQGYTVLEAFDVEDALKICQERKEPIHLILTDVVMPGMSGRQLLDRCWQVRQDLKVLYMSGYTDNAIVHHGVLQEGMSYLQKPFTVESLARKVREVLDK